MTLATETLTRRFPNDPFARISALFRLRDDSMTPTTSGIDILLSESIGTDDVLSVMSQGIVGRVTPPSRVINVTGPATRVPGAAASMTSADVISRVDIEMVRMEAAAEKGDDYAFIRAMKQVDWTHRDAADYMRAVRLALSSGAYFQARQLSAEGAKRFSNHSELQTAAHVLAPPRVIRSSEPARPKMRADTEWVKKHSDEYRGMWVALREGDLLGADVDLPALVKQLGSTKGIFFTRIY